MIEEIELGISSNIREENLAFVTPSSIYSSFSNLIQDILGATPWLVNRTSSLSLLTDLTDLIELLHSHRQVVN
jgi:hypothetical protein